MKKKIKKFFTGFFDLDGKNHISGYELFGIFMICNVLGYCIEMVYGYITNGYWESRQSLVIGPFGLAYGLGGILLSVFLYKDYNKKWWKIFLKSMLLGSIAEYIMSLGEELVFGHVSWDYSNIPLNLNGRICLLYSIYWGILGLVWVKIIYPLFIKFIHKIPIVLGKILFWALFIFMFFDIIMSCEAVSRHQQRQMDIPAQNSFDEFLDKHFDDEFIKKVYANAVEV